jgi:hypothetical protein
MADAYRLLEGGDSVMSTFDKVAAELGDGPKYARRSDFTKYHGYADGENIGTFDTITEAFDAGAKTTEKVFDEVGCRAADSAYREHQARIVQTWMDRLKAENKDISDEVFSLVYADAYERGHSCGHNEVELYLEEGLDLARKIIATVKP